ncbi:MAG: hypothetical protein JST40_12130 [Armatimonadetes bacterium]|nr:hypothetical protein [Armatimonadota bacterium]
MKPKSSQADSSSSRIRTAITRTVCLMGGLTLAFMALSSKDSFDHEVVASAAVKQAQSNLVVVGFNELGMHCMNEDFSELCILPPFNTFRAQLIRRGDNPDVVRTGAVVNFSILGNTVSHTKTNFWDYEDKLFGVNLAPDTGLTGTGLSGRMFYQTAGWYEATGIPVTPVMDDGTPNAYNVGQITATYDGLTGSTQAVIPVSWEISCNLCHGIKKASPVNGTRGPKDGAPPKAGGAESVGVATDILADHDRLHGTHLMNQRPVLCASCHADPALGTTGVAGVKTMSAAMHGAHASRMGQANLTNACYACHPGVKTNCQRDVHYTQGIYCTNCHGSMTAMGSTTRTPWKDEPKCSNCHNVSGHQYEETGKLFKDSKGHGGVFCVTCHNAPHAITPAATALDNAQTLRLQDHIGTLDKCLICHTRQPNESFPHRRDD